MKIPPRQASPSMRNLTAFFGIEGFDSVAVDALDLLFEPPESLLARGMEEARQLARTW